MFSRGGQIWAKPQLVSALPGTSDGGRNLPEPHFLGHDAGMVANVTLEDSPQYLTGSV